MDLKSLRIRTDLSEQDKRKLLALLAVRKSRGLSIPQIDMANLSASDGWNVDSSGFFHRNGTGKPYSPAPGHRGFIESKAIFVALQAGRGAGKTAAGAQKAMRKIREGRTGVVVNPDLENFKTSTWPELRNWIPWEMVIPRHRIRRSEAWDVTRPFSIVFLNGAIMYCRGLRDPESARGHNVNWLWYDEARRDKTGAAWKNAIAGVRVGEDTQRFLTTTPAGTDSWIAALFDRNEIPKEVYDLLEELGELGKRPIMESFHVSLEENKANLDPIFYATLVSAYPAGYLRQREVDGIAANAEGALGDRTWFKDHVLDAPPAWAAKRIRFWDLAASEKKVGEDPDETIGTLLSENTKKDAFCIEDQTGGFMVWDKLKAHIQRTALRDGTNVVIYIEQEPGSGGKNQIAEIANILRPLGFRVIAHNPRDDGDRVIAANTWFAEAAERRWWIVKGAWNDKFYIQLDSFPEGAHDDRVTSITGARHSISPIRKFSTIKFDHIGAHGKKEEKKDGTGRIGAWGKPGK
jgi:predicted phage terminase large subunit-like protein